MGWVWINDDESEIRDNYRNPNRGSTTEGKVCSTRKVVSSKCKTEEVEPGKFLRKCEKTEETLRECLGQPVEVIQSNKEYTEDDVTDQIVKGSSEGFDVSPFSFPGLRHDMEGMERHIFGGMSRFFEAAEQMRNGILDIFGEIQKETPPSFPSMRREIPVEDYSRNRSSSKQKETESGDFDLSGLAKDV